MKNKVKIGFVEWGRNMLSLSSETSLFPSFATGQAYWFRSKIQFWSVLNGVKIAVINHMRDYEHFWFLVVGWEEVVSENETNKKGICSFWVVRDLFESESELFSRLFECLMTFWNSKCAPRSFQFSYPFSPGAMPRLSRRSLERLLKVTRTAYLKQKTKRRTHSSHQLPWNAVVAPLFNWYLLSAYQFFVPITNTFHSLFIYPFFFLFLLVFVWFLIRPSRISSSFSSSHHPPSGQLISTPFQCSHASSSPSSCPIPSDS